MRPGRKWGPCPPRLEVKLPVVEAAAIRVPGTAVVEAFAAAAVRVPGTAVVKAFAAGVAVGVPAAAVVGAFAAAGPVRGPGATLVSQKSHEPAYDEVYRVAGCRLSAGGCLGSLRFR